MEISIRSAEILDPRDYRALIDMATEFFHASPYAALQPDPSEITRSLRHIIGLLGEPPHILLIARDACERPLGMIALFVTPHLFMANVLAANEVAWWVTPEGRAAGIGGKLLDVAEEAAKQVGVRIIQMLALSNSPAVAREVYEKRGYQPTETAYTKVL